MKTTSFSVFFKNLGKKMFGKIIQDQIDDFQKKEIAPLVKEVDDLKEKLTSKKIEQITNLYTFENKDLSVRLEKRTNKDEMIFHTSKPCWVGARAAFFVSFPFVDGRVHYWANSFTSGMRDTMNTPPITESSLLKFINTMFDLNCIAKIETTNSFEFTITKSAALSWDEVTPKVLEAIQSLFPEIPQTEI